MAATVTRYTITEALADLKTIGARIEKKREFIGANLARQFGLTDPLEKAGGSVAIIQRELQAIADLEKRHLAIRTSIQRVNHETPITVEGVTHSIAEWLTWRKEIAPGIQTWNKRVRDALAANRKQAQQKGFGVVSATAIVGAEPERTDLIVNIDEAALAASIEQMETILGTLDGQLSLKNATVMIEIPD